jgi:hypothetical protein
MLWPLVEDQRNGGPSFHIVYVRRLAVQPLHSRIGRPRPRLARLALQRCEQRRLLAADESAGS